MSLTTIPAWATRTLIVRKLKGLEDIIGELLVRFLRTVINCDILLLYYIISCTLGVLTYVQA